MMFGNGVAVQANGIGCFPGQGVIGIILGKGIGIIGWIEIAACATVIQDY